MCSIIGFLSDHRVAPRIVQSLKRMECIGYDSVGVATKNHDSITVIKGIGKVDDVNNKLHMDDLNGNVGIGHTRWATHGGVTDENAHPHLCQTGSIGIVHNGIIENHVELRDYLEKNHNIVFKSDTDTEIIPNLLQVNLEKSHDVKQAIMDTVKQLKDHYAFVALFKDGTMVGVRNHEPLILGIGNNDELLLISDVLGFTENITSAIYIDNEQFVVIDKSKFRIYNFEGNVAQYVAKPITKKNKQK